MEGTRTKTNGRLLMTKEEHDQKQEAEKASKDEALERKLETLEEEGPPKAKLRKPMSQEARDNMRRKMIQHYKDHPEAKKHLSEVISASWDDEMKERQAVKMTKVLAKGSPAYKKMLAGMARAKKKREAKKAKEEQK